MATATRCPISFVPCTRWQPNLQQQQQALGIEAAIDRTAYLPPRKRQQYRPWSGLNSYR
eukprot:COSAG02_NODE_18895_length_911_cov_1.644089_1_plen_58_part_01